MSSLSSLPSSDAALSDLYWRPLHDTDLAPAHVLSQGLGWPHRIEDWAMMLELGEGVALEDPEGTLIGTGFCLPQGQAATLGLVIVDDAWQGKGLGRAMMTRLMALAGDRTQFLVATVAGAPLYQKLGFTPCNTVCQYQGVVTTAVQVPDTDGLRAVTDEDLESVMALAPDNAVHRKAVDQATEGAVIERDGQLVGMALRRPFGRGEQIGPVLAETPEQARALMASLLARAEGAFVRLDLVDPEDDQWLVDTGLACVDRVVRMRRGPDSDAAALVRFGLITQAMG
ncbi:GNAT family N-acetyltransferase [Kushneria indalinina]|uniref:Acetyltransferase (GNAT) family protein n=1 Tax=Kushneria indalinina DSM 14324 TaxID=1122140 RepID=A0A3D9DTS6_9GAMM|nr:GNAT family N-acetyltransferase [Kushneria indalinina]REC93819.1 acetyltransferase (GNAT) family protein [Kushneria indalinina DSM 14324]